MLQTNVNVCCVVANALYVVECDWLALIFKYMYKNSFCVGMNNYFLGENNFRMTYGALPHRSKNKWLGFYLRIWKTFVGALLHLRTARLITELLIHFYEIILGMFWHYTFKTLDNALLGRTGQSTFFTKAQRHSQC